MFFSVLIDQPSYFCSSVFLLPIRKSVVVIVLFIYCNSLENEDTCHGCVLLVVYKQEAEFEKKLVVVQRQLHEKDGQHKVLFVNYFTASFLKYLFVCRRFFLFVLPYFSHTCIHHCVLCVIWIINYYGAAL